MSDVVVWVEIEGLPYAYGNASKDSTWFTPRADTAQEFLGIRPWFTRDTMPSLPPQNLDHIEGTVSGGSLRLSIDDIDGSLTALTAASRTDDLLRLWQDVDYDDDPLHVIGDNSGWPSSGTAYVRYETITYGSKTASTATVPGTIATLTRGRYRSRAVSHDGGVLTSSSVDNSTDRASVGAAVTPYPLRLEGRRVWLYVGYSPTTIADCTCLWSGVIEEVGFEDDALQTMTLSCSQAFGELQEGVCADLGSFGAPMREGDQVEWFVAGRTQALANDFRDFEKYSFRGRPWRTVTATDTSDKRRTFLVDGWQVLRLRSNFTSVPFSQVDASAATSRYDYSNVTENPVSGGTVNSIAKEVVLITDGGQEPFTATRGSAATNHPLLVLLQFLMSGQGNTTGGVYDTLPPGFGLAMDPERVDVDGIAALIDETPDLRVYRVIDQPIEDFGEWARTVLLKPFGFYLRASLGNRLGVGRMAPPGPDNRANAVTIDINAGGIHRAGLGNWRRDVNDVVSTIRVLSGEQPTKDGFRSINTGTLQLTSPDGRLIRLDYPKARTIEVDFGGMSGYGAVEENAGKIFSYAVQIAARFSAPPALVDVTVGLGHALREVGEFVALTHVRIPSQFSATRGVAAQLWEIVGRRVDIGRAEVVLTLRQTNVAQLETRYLAPAMLIDTKDSPTEFGIAQAYYVASGQNATDAFAAGDYVRVYDPNDLSDRLTVRRIVGITGAVVELDDGTDVNGGDIIIHADYAEWDIGVSDPATKSVAFRASGAETLTDSAANTDVPHELA